MKPRWWTFYCRGDASMTQNAAKSTVMAWTAASDASAVVNPVTRDCAGNMQTSSSKLAAQSKVSVGVHDAKQPRTQSEFVYQIYYAIPMVPKCYLGTDFLHC